MSELAKKTIQVLRDVAAAPDGVGLSDLARATGIPKATCLRILGVLEEEHMVLLREDSKRYVVSIGVLALASRLLDPGAGYQHAQAEIEGLSARVQETCGLDVLSDRQVMVIMQVQGPNLLSQAHGAVPRLLPVWPTSTGKALLAYLPEERLAEMPLDEIPGRSRDEILAELEQVRERSYAYAYEELEPYLAAVSAPVWVRDTVVGAVWVGGPTFRIERERLPELAEEVKASAARLSTLITGTGGAFLDASASAGAVER